MILKWFWFYLDEIRNNFRSGLTVSLVSVPLSISLAIAGGASPISGIVTAFYCGLFGSIFGGSEFNIVGPTGALSGLLAAAATAYNPLILPWLSIYGGILCLFVWTFNLVGYLMVIPSSVVHGFTLGVAFIIGLGQLDFALGLEIHHSRDLNFIEKVSDSLDHIHEIRSIVPFIFFLVNFIFLFTVVKIFPKVPWNILLCIVGGCIGFMGQTYQLWPASDLTTLGQHFNGVNWKLDLFILPQWTDGVLSSSAFSDAVSIAFIGILETLISARMADEMNGKTHHDRNKEVFGLGIANIVGGLFGGIPATAALARTSLNVQSGATSRVSGFINAFMLLIISKLLLPYFCFVPMPTIAAILVLVAVRMVDVAHLAHLYRYEPRQFYISLFTAVLCVLVDTMTGLVIGSILSLIIYAENLSDGNSEIQIFSYVVTTDSYRAAPETEKIFLAEVNVQLLDSYSLGDHIFHLFKKFRYENWGTGVTDSSRGNRTFSSNTEFSPLLMNNVTTNKEIKVATSNLSSTPYEDILVTPRSLGRSRHKSIISDCVVFNSGNDTLLPLIAINGIAGVSSITSGRLTNEVAYFMPSPDINYALMYRIAGQLTYVNAASHVHRAERASSRIQGFKKVVISMRTVWTIDLDGVDALHTMCQIFENLRLIVILDGVDRIEYALRDHEFYQTLLNAGQVVEKWTQILEE